MKKLLLGLFVSVLSFLFLLVGCDTAIGTTKDTLGNLETTEADEEITSCNHAWRDATCTTPKTCSTCGKTSGTSLGHSWNEATCTTPKTCVNCKKTTGGLREHDWLPATCSTPKMCLGCKKTSGKIDSYAHSGAFTCDLCNKNYYNVLKNYISLHGKEDAYEGGLYWYIEDTVVVSGQFYDVTLGYNNGGDGWLYCTIEEDRNSGLYDNYNITLSIESSSEIHTYSYWDWHSLLSYDRLAGTVNAKEFTPNTSSLSVDRFICDDGYHSEEFLSQKCAELLKALLKCFDEICEDRNLGIGTKDFGFVNYTP